MNLKSKIVNTIIILSKAVPFRKKIINTLKYRLATEKEPVVRREDTKRLFNEWLAQTEESNDDTEAPLISVVVPTYNTSVELLKRAICSVKQQSYKNWELVIVDDASTDTETIEYLKSLKDNKIKVQFRTKNGHISSTTNDAVALSSGDYIALLDHDDELTSDALYRNYKAIKDHVADFIYSDEGKITESGDSTHTPFHKPDWNYDMLRSVNYITHFAVIKKSLIEQVGGFDSKCDGAQDWDLFLRVSRVAKKIYHIPELLYYWRIIEGSTAMDTSQKPYVIEAQKQALRKDLEARGVEGVVTDGVIKDYRRVDYSVENTKGKVSIIIPTLNELSVLKKCVKSVFKYTNYSNFEIVIVDTGSSEDVFKWYDTITKKHSNIIVSEWKNKPFSFSEAVNYGFSMCDGEYVLLLNNDTEVVSGGWLTNLLGDATQDGVGAVGPMLLYPDKKHIQHAGIGIGLGGVAANLLSKVFIDGLRFHQHVYGQNKRNVSAVTGACLLTTRSIYEEVNGFDEDDFKVTFNDVDFCLKLLEKGYRIIYNPYVQLIHHESLSLGEPEDDKRDSKEFNTAKNNFVKKWQTYIDHDPNMNPNLGTSDANMEPINH